MQYTQAYSRRLFRMVASTRYRFGLLGTARHPPAGQSIPWRVMLQRRQRTDLSFLSGYFTEFFDSGTSALAIAIARALDPLVKSGFRPSVLLPAYGCPNLVSATLWAGGQPEFIDLAPGSIIPDERELVARLNTRDVVVVAVDAFGVPSLSNAALMLPVADPTLPLVHDLAQSFAPYADGWKNIAPQSILSFGRAKPMSLTMGGGLISVRTPIMGEPKQVPDLARVSLAMLLPRMAVYNWSLHPSLFGPISMIPLLRIGQTELRAHEFTAKYSCGFDALVHSAAGVLAKEMPKLIGETNDMLELAMSCPVIIPAPIANMPPQTPLWRLPVVVASKRAADKLEADGRAFGVTRLYGKTLPEFHGLSAEECASRWPNAYKLSRQIVTLPTHGRLGLEKLEQLRNLVCVRVNRAT